MLVYQRQFFLMVVIDPGAVGLLMMSNKGASFLQSVLPMPIWRRGSGDLGLKKIGIILAYWQVRELLWPSLSLHQGVKETSLETALPTESILLGDPRWRQRKLAHRLSISWSF